MKPIQTICVYCGSSPGREPDFQLAAEALGAEMARRGIGLVYGGGGTGLMGTVARAVIAGGGHVTGIIPAFLREREVQFNEASELIVVNDMHERKALMFQRSDAFVALPGGVGTLEEIIEVMTWAQLGQHEKPILIADIAGFWKPLLVLLAHMRHSAFIRAETEVHYMVAERVSEIIPMLLAAGPEARLELAANR